MGARSPARDSLRVLEAREGSHGASTLEIMHAGQFTRLREEIREKVLTIYATSCRIGDATRNRVKFNTKERRQNNDNSNTRHNHLR